MMNNLTEYNNKKFILNQFIFFIKVVKNLNMEFKFKEFVYFENMYDKNVVNFLCVLGLLRLISLISYVKGVVFNINLYSIFDELQFIYFVNDFVFLDNVKLKLKNVFKDLDLMFLFYDKELYSEDDLICWFNNINKYFLDFLYSFFNIKDINLIKIKTQSINDEDLYVKFINYFMYSFLQKYELNTDFNNIINFNDYYFIFNFYLEFELRRMFFNYISCEDFLLNIENYFIFDCNLVSYSYEFFKNLFIKIIDYIYIFFFRVIKVSNLITREAFLLKVFISYKDIVNNEFNCVIYKEYENDVVRLFNKTGLFNYFILNLFIVFFYIRMLIIYIKNINIVDYQHVLYFFNKCVLLYNLYCEFIFNNSVFNVKNLIDNFNSLLLKIKQDLTKIYVFLNINFCYLDLFFYNKGDLVLYNVLSFIPHFISIFLILQEVFQKLFNIPIESIPLKNVDFLKDIKLFVSYFIPEMVVFYKNHYLLVKNNDFYIIENYMLLFNLYVEFEFIDYIICQNKDINYYNSFFMEYIEINFNDLDLTYNKYQHLVLNLFECILRCVFNVNNKLK